MADAPAISVSKSQIKGYLKEKHELRTAGDTIDVINDEVAALLDKAAARAKAANKATVAPHHV